jgi:hypothetical protein
MSEGPRLPLGSLPRARALGRTAGRDWGNEINQLNLNDLFLRRPARALRNVSATSTAERAARHQRPRQLREGEYSCGSTPRALSQDSFLNELLRQLGTVGRADSQPPYDPPDAGDEDTPPAAGFRARLMPAGWSDGTVSRLNPGSLVNLAG